MITFKHKDSNSLVIRQIDSEAPIEDIVREFRYFLTALTFSDGTINRYTIEPDLIKFSKKKNP